MVVLPLYAGLSSDEQEKATKTKYDNHRKVIVSTNFAEASVTISNLFYVIDPGFANVASYNATLNRYEICKIGIDKAAANQRKGRAGREFVPYNTKDYKYNEFDKIIMDFTDKEKLKPEDRNIPGFCDRLYTMDYFTNFKETSDPKILSEELSTNYLKLKALDKDPRTFMWMTSPSEDQFSRAETILVALGAIESEGSKNITIKGKMMARFPLKPSYSVILIHSLNREYACTKKALSLISILSALEKIDNLYITEYPDYLSDDELKKYKKELTNKQNEQLDALIPYGDDNTNTQKITSDHIKLLAIYEDYLDIKNSSNAIKKNSEKKLREKIERETREELEIKDESLSLLNDKFKIVLETKLKNNSDEFKELENKSEDDVKKWCESKYLNKNELDKISIQRKKLLNILVDICAEISGVAKHPKWNKSTKQEYTRYIDANDAYDSYNSIQKCILTSYFLNIAKWDIGKKRYKVLNQSNDTTESLAMPHSNSLVSRFPKKRRSNANEQIMWPKYICYDTFMLYEASNNNLIDNKENKPDTVQFLLNCSEIKIKDMLKFAPDYFSTDYFKTNLDSEELDYLESLIRKDLDYSKSVDSKDGANGVNDILKRKHNLESIPIDSSDKNSQFKALAYHIGKKPSMDNFMDIKIEIFEEIKRYPNKYDILDINHYTKNNNSYLNEYDYYSSDVFFNIEGDLRTLRAAANIFKKKIVIFYYSKEYKNLDFDIISPKTEKVWEQPFEIIYICKNEQESYGPVISRVKKELFSSLLDSKKLLLKFKKDDSYSDSDYDSDSDSEVKQNLAIYEFNKLNYEKHKTTFNLLFQFPENQIIFLDTYQGNTSKSPLTKNGCVLLSIIISATYVFEGISITKERIEQIINIDTPNVINKIRDINTNLYKPGVFYEQTSIESILIEHIKKFDNVEYNKSDSNKEKFADLEITFTGINILNPEHIARMITEMTNANSVNQKVGCSFQFSNQIGHAITILYEPYSKSNTRGKWIVIDTLKSKSLVENSYGDSGTMTICVDDSTLIAYLKYYFTNAISMKDGDKYAIELGNALINDPTSMSDTEYGKDIRNFSAHIFSLST